jgi:hypothetical protein
MPILTGALIQEGALVDGLVGLSEPTLKGLRTALRPVPSPIHARALLDTGAEISCIDSSVVQNLGLSLAGTTFANLPAHGGLTLGALYDIGLTILHPSNVPQNNLTIPTLCSLELSLAHLGYQMLIGRDVLARCRFLFDGPRNKFHLAY